MRQEDAFQNVVAKGESLKQFSAAALYLFGSVARNESHDRSDVDILVEFESGTRVGLFELI